MISIVGLSPEQRIGLPQIQKSVEQAALDMMGQYPHLIPAIYTIAAGTIHDVNSLQTSPLISPITNLENELRRRYRWDPSQIGSPLAAANWLY